MLFGIVLPVQAVVAIALTGTAVIMETQDVMNADILAKEEMLYQFQL
jgi:hypothetical protein